jgi:hypothetical protein
VGTERTCCFTAAFDMGQEGFAFNGTFGGFEGYVINMNQHATFTPGIDPYEWHDGGQKHALD